MKRRPRPVLFVNLLTAISEAIVPFVALMGWLDWTVAQFGGLMVMIIGASNALKTYLSQSRVTPNADPRDNWDRSLAVRNPGGLPPRPRGSDSRL